MIADLYGDATNPQVAERYAQLQRIDDIHARQQAALEEMIRKHPSDPRRSAWERNLRDLNAQTTITRLGG